jgi:predicted acylesterase/phospholipase RssA
MILAEGSSLMQTRIQVAFQGGGAKLFALLAAAEACEEAAGQGHLEVTRIAGTSAGAIVGGLWAAGCKLQDLRVYFGRLSLEDLLPQPKKLKSPWARLWRHAAADFARRQVPSSGPGTINTFKILLDCLKHSEPLVPEAKLRDILQGALSHCAKIKNPAQFKISECKRPFYAVATKLHTREKAIQGPADSTSLIDALINSAALPFIFRGPTQASSTLFDGGLYENLPSSALLSTAPGDLERFGRILAFGFEPADANNIETPLDLLLAIVDTLIESNVDSSKASPEVFIVKLPDCGVRTLDFAKSQRYLGDTALGSPYSEAAAQARRGIMDMIAEPPAEFIDAIKRRQYLMHYNQLVIKNTEVRAARPYSLISYPYTKIKEIKELQQRLKSLFRRSFGEPQNDPKEFEGQVFDITERPDIALTSEAVCVFPFYLSYMRRPAWGVVPWGRHCAFGLLLNRRHQAYSTIANRASSARHLRTNWVAPFLEKVMDPGRLLIQEGFLFNETFPMFVSRYGDAETKRRFYRFARRLNLRTVDSPEFQNLNPETDAIVFDLALRDQYLKLARSIDSNFQTFSAYHELAIPVGLGYSLLAADRIGKQLWKDVLQETRDQLSKAAEGLRDAGIELLVKKEISR